MKNSINIDFESISPSAKALLLNKAKTSIPFAREAVKVIWGNNNFLDTTGKKHRIRDILRRIHFETRYLSIDIALSDIGIKNILEFSSGYSFRGLSLCKNPEITYIDTDLPTLINNKELIVQELAKHYCNYPLDNLIMKGLNILDEEAFNKIVQIFPPGSVAIVNEGLLMYLDKELKQKLCKNINRILKERGGYWITADIYVKKDEQSLDIFDKGGKEFLAKHHVEEHKFDGFESAKAFFSKNGFKIYKKIEVTPSQVSSRKLLSEIPLSTLKELKDRKKTWETWILGV